MCGFILFYSVVVGFFFFLAGKGLDCLSLYLELMTVLLGAREGIEEKKLVEMDCCFKVFLLRQNVLEKSSKNRKSHSCLRCWKDVGRTHGLISCSATWQTWSRIGLLRILLSYLICHKFTEMLHCEKDGLACQSETLRGERNREQ